MLTAFPALPPSVTHYKNRGDNDTVAIVKFPSEAKSPISPFHNVAYITEGGDQAEGSNAESESLKSKEVIKEEEEEEVCLFNF